MMRPSRFSIPEAMLPYFMYALWNIDGETRNVKAVKTSKGYDIEYEMSREDDNRVRSIMIKAWKERDLPSLEY